LRALEDDGFRVTCLRLPFMFGPGDGSLLAPLARLMSKCRAMPVPRPLPQRSMITFVDAAHVVASVIAQPGDRDVNAADPLPFTFALLANAIAEQTSRRIRLIGLPRPAIALAGLAAPRLKHSLFATNLLDPAINLAANLDLPLGLRRGLAGLVAAQHA
jgi:nucleoside-diphosphate-sugar epimerase